MKFSGKVGNGPVNKWLNSGGDLGHHLDTGIVFRIHHYLEIRKVVNGHKSGDLLLVVICQMGALVRCALVEDLHQGTSYQCWRYALSQCFKLALLFIDSSFQFLYTFRWLISFYEHCCHCYYNHYILTYNIIIKSLCTNVVIFKSILCKVCILYSYLRTHYLCYLEVCSVFR